MSTTARVSCITGIESRAAIGDGHGRQASDATLSGMSSPMVLKGLLRMQYSFLCEAISFSRCCSKEGPQRGPYEYMFWSESHSTCASAVLPSIYASDP